MTPETDYLEEKLRKDNQQRQELELQLTLAEVRIKTDEESSIQRRCCRRKIKRFCRFSYPLDWSTHWDVIGGIFGVVLTVLGLAIGVIYLQGDSYGNS